MLNFVTIEKFAEISGYTKRAIEQKRYDGTWREGEVWIKAPDNRILINVEGYELWVSKAKALSRLVRPVFRSRSPIKAKLAAKTSSASPLPLTLP